MKIYSVKFLEKDGITEHECAEMWPEYGQCLVVDSRMMGGKVHLLKSEWRDSPQEIKKVAKRKAKAEIRKLEARIERLKTLDFDQITEIN